MKRNYILGIVAVAVFASCGTPAAVSSSTTANASTEEKAKPDQVAKTSRKEVKQLVMTAALTEGKDLYDNNCAKCHRLFEASEYKKEEWAPILVEMQQKAHLNDAQMASISNYIYAQL
ncbi:MAG: cytochrome c [Flavobacterium sp.]|nr:cytochrome c [Flavobacterium sp.]